MINVKAQMSNRNPHEKCHIADREQRVANHEHETHGHEALSGEERVFRRPVSGSLGNGVLTKSVKRRDDTVLLSRLESKKIPQGIKGTHCRRLRKLQEEYRWLKG